MSTELTPEQIIEMAKQAEISVPLYFNAVAAARVTELQAFAQLVRNAALEEAAQLCDLECDNWANDRPIRLCANLIRIRKS